MNPQRTIEAKPTTYKGVAFRSATEARAAQYFDANGLKWIYEPEQFSAGNLKYTPDFWLPEIQTLVEIKPFALISEAQTDRVRIVVESIKVEFAILCEFGHHDFRPVQVFGRAENSENNDQPTWQWRGIDYGLAPLSERDIAKFRKQTKPQEIPTKPLQHITASSLNRYQSYYSERGTIGVPYGIPALDQVSGGMKPGQTIVIAGPTGGGKTTVALHVALSALHSGNGVAMFSLEMDAEELFDQVVSNRCGIDRNKFNNGQFHPENDLAAMSREMSKISSLPFYIEDRAAIDASEICQRVMQLKAESSIGLVIVDYIQFVNPTNPFDSREQQVAQISHALRALARDARIPIIVLSQLNDEGKLRESRVIAHNANVVLSLEIRPSTYSDSDDTMLIKVVKGRGIPCGEHQMRFERRFCRLLPIET